MREQPPRGFIDCRVQTRVVVEGSVRVVRGKEGRPLLMKQLHLLHSSELLNTRAALSMCAFYLSHIKVLFVAETRAVHAFFRFSREINSRKCFWVSRSLRSERIRVQKIKLSS